MVTWVGDESEGTGVIWAGQADLELMGSNPPPAGLRKISKGLTYRDPTLAPGELLWSYSEGQHEMYSPYLC